MQLRMIADPNAPQMPDGHTYVHGDHHWVSGTYPNEFKFWCLWCEDEGDDSCTWLWWDAVEATFEAPCDNGCCDCLPQELLRLRCAAGVCEGLKYNAWINTALGSVLCQQCFDSEVVERV